VKGSHGGRDLANPHETIFIASRSDLVPGPMAMHEIADKILGLFVN
jgi:hypothetical protein